MARNMEFNWTEADLVVHPVQAVTAYPTQHGVVIRQQKQNDRDRDDAVMIPHYSIDLLIRRRGRQLVDALISAVVAVVLTVVLGARTSAATTATGLHAPQSGCRRTCAARADGRGRGVMGNWVSSKSERRIGVLQDAQRCSR